MTTNYIEPETSNVIGVQFGIMGPDEILKNSVVEVEKHDTFKDDKPVVKGLFDIRMGTTDNDKVCGTCNQGPLDCPGHFGHLKLARPIYHYQYITMIQKILRCTCFNCSRLLINKESPKISSLLNKSNKHRWNEIYTASQKIDRCGQENGEGCGAKQPEKLKLDGVNGLYAVWDVDGEQKTQHLTVEEVKTIFEKMTDEDINILGFSETWCRPEWLILSVFPVPPPSMRPSVKQEDSQRMDDDLTHKLFDIIKTNDTLRQKIEANSNQNVIDDWTKVLQYHCATFIDNELLVWHRLSIVLGDPLKAIRQRLKGKEGRIRNNLMGKRVDHSARSVITPDPNIELDELGVPLTIAKNLTYPEIVNKYNRDKLEKLVSSGPDIYPGVKLIESKGKKTTITKSNYLSISLNDGDVVHRQLLDGDWVLFNRQPSLHKMSMMAHRVRVMKGNTFRLNVSVTPPYNADFDGDEMNMHAPQSVESVCELMNIIAGVIHQIVSPRSNKPIITIVQDTLLGIHKLTRGERIEFSKRQSDGVYYSNNTNIYPVAKSQNEGIVDSSVFTKNQVMNIICGLSTFNGVLPEPSYKVDYNGEKISMWTGRDMLSYIIPDNVNLEMENGMYDSDSNDFLNKIIIKNGKIVSGSFDKNSFTKTSKGLIHTIYNDHGPEKTKNFIDDLQRIVNSFLTIEGFSVGIGDMIADDETSHKINEAIQENKQNIEKIMQEIHLNIFENFSGQSNSEYFESKVNDLLNKTLDQTEKMGLSNLESKNRVTTMVNCGSKGKTTNVSQIIARLGQQNVDGRRIPNGFIDRTLPHYKRFDDSAEARGFVENSFISGQSPQEYFFHAMGGREGLIDTAVKTSETGYIQRKLIKSMEDLFIDYDYSVRNSSGCIIQFMYGEDAIDSIKIESQSLLIMNKDTDKICKMFSFAKNYNWSKYLDPDIIVTMKKDKQYYRKLSDSLKRILTHKENVFLNAKNKNDISNSVNCPIHIERITQNICMNNSMSGLSTISPLEILSENEKLKRKLYVNQVGDYMTVSCLCLLIFIFTPNSFLRSIKYNQKNTMKLFKILKAYLKSH